MFETGELSIDRTLKKTNLSSASFCFLEIWISNLSNHKLVLSIYLSPGLRFVNIKVSVNHGLDLRIVAMLVL